MSTTEHGNKRLLNVPHKNTLIHVLIVELLFGRVARFF
jgi:hypothetical protein